MQCCLCECGRDRSQYRKDKRANVLTPASFNLFPVPVEKCVFSRLCAASCTDLPSRVAMYTHVHISVMGGTIVTRTNVREHLISFARRLSSHCWKHRIHRQIISYIVSLLSFLFVSCQCVYTVSHYCSRVNIKWNTMYSVHVSGPLRAVYTRREFSVLNFRRYVPKTMLQIFAVVPISLFFLSYLKSNSLTCFKF